MELLYFYINTTVISARFLRLFPESVLAPPSVSLSFSARTGLRLMKIDFVNSVIFARTGLLYCGFLCVPATLSSRWVFQGGGEEKF
jgi:hypothetical protein